MYQVQVWYSAVYCCCIYDLTSVSVFPRLARLPAILGGRWGLRCNGTGVRSGRSQRAHVRQFYFRWQHQQHRQQSCGGGDRRVEGVAQLKVAFARGLSGLE